MALGVALNAQLVDIGGVFSIVAMVVGVVVVVGVELWSRTEMVTLLLVAFILADILYRLAEPTQDYSKALYVR